MSSADDALQSMFRNLEEKTGKSAAEWIALVRSSTLKKHSDLVKWLKTEHGLTHGYANTVVIKALESPEASTASETEQIDALFTGAKAPLRPIYDAIVSSVRSFGLDIELAPKKTYVSLRRKKQFGLLQPSTATRFDVGINLRGTAAQGRLEASGSFSAMVSHRVRIANLKEVDQELIAWLRTAYDAS